MAINKITDAQIAQYGVQASPNQLTGSAEENKKVFDRLIANVVAVYFNAMVDALTAPTGAGEVGAAVDGIEESNVLGVLAALKALRDSDSSAQGATNTSLQAEIDNRYTKAQTNALLGEKVDTVTANELVKSIGFDSDSGVFTITTMGGAVTTFDTMIEKVPAGFSFEGNQLVLTLEDGTKQYADLSAFIDTYTFTNGGTVVFSQTGKNITAEVKDGSLALSKLTPEVKATLEGYAVRAENAQEKAKAAQTAAEAAKTTAQGAATTATTKASEASASATQAKNSQTGAASAQSGAVTAQVKAEAAANEAESYAKGGTGTRTNEDTDNAKYYAEKAKEYRDQAGEVVGGDFATRAEVESAKQEAINAVGVVQGNLNSHTEDAVKHITADERTAWNGKAEAAKTGQITLTAAGWSGNGTFAQAVSHANIRANTQVNVDASIALLNQMEADGVLAVFIENDGGVATAYAKGAAFTADVTIDVTFVEVSV